MNRKPKLLFISTPTGNDGYFRKLFEESQMAKQKPTPEELQRYLQTHYPNRKERRILEKRYKKQQALIKSGKLKPKKVKIKKITLWQRFINFIKRKK